MVAFHTTESSNSHDQNPVKGSAAICVYLSGVIFQITPVSTRPTRLLLLANIKELKILNCFLIAD